MDKLYILLPTVLAVYAVPASSFVWGPVLMRKFKAAQEARTLIAE